MVVLHLRNCVKAIIRLFARQTCGDIHIALMKRKIYQSELSPYIMNNIDAVGFKSKLNITLLESVDGVSERWN
jgi:hypothetical protein